MLQLLLSLAFSLGLGRPLLLFSLVLFVLLPPLPSFALLKLTCFLLFAALLFLELSLSFLGLACFAFLLSLLLFLLEGTSLSLGFLSQALFLFRFPLGILFLALLLGLPSGFLGFLLLLG